MKNVAYLAFIAAMASLVVSAPVDPRPGAGNDGNGNKSAPAGNKANAIAGRTLGLGKTVGSGRGANVDVNKIVGDSLGLASGIVGAVLGGKKGVK